MMKLRYIKKVHVILVLLLGFVLISITMNNFKEFHPISLINHTSSLSSTQLPHGSSYLQGADDDLDDLSDQDELLYCSELNASDPDSDDDGLPDGWEVEYGFNPLPFVTTPSLNWGTISNPKLNVFRDQSLGGCDLKVKSHQLHQNCLQFTDPSGETIANRWKTYFDFSSRTQGSIEFYFLSTDTMKTNAFYVLDEGSPDSITITMSDGWLYHYDGVNNHAIMSISSAVWYHFLITFDCSSDWHLWVNGYQLDEGDGYPFRGNPSAMDILYFLGDTEANDFSVYYDNMGFSWNSGETNDAIDDPDEDSLSNLGEFTHETNPLIADSDFDGFSDGYEVTHGSDPADYASIPTNTDDTTSSDSNTETNSESGGIDFGEFSWIWYLLIPILVVGGVVFVFLFRNKATDLPRTSTPIRKKVDSGQQQTIMNSPRSLSNSSSLRNSTPLNEIHETKLGKFKRIMNISRRIEIQTVAQMLHISTRELMENLLQWGEQIPFKIDGQVIIVDDLSSFTNAIDEQFDMWTEKEFNKEGKN